MAIRKSIEENIQIQCAKNEIFLKIEDALKKGKFQNITKNEFTNQIGAKYQKLTIWGEIIISIIENGNSFMLNIKSKANVDNIFALFTSPNQKIINNFKQNLHDTD
jgi:hypothetical protein